MGQGLAEQRYLLDARTGEALPATTENAYVAITAARELKRRADEVIADATGFLLERSREEGKKTFHTSAGDVVLSGGPETQYDPETLEQLLREAGCPEERIREVVKEEVVTTYKVDRNVLRQLVGANPAYAAAAERAAREIEKPWRATPK